MSATDTAAAPQYSSRTIPLSNGATVDVSSLENGRVVFGINGSTSTVQVNVVMDREHLTAIRAGINAVLAETDGQS